MKIEEQVEEFVYRDKPCTENDWEKTIQYRKDLYALLRSFVEEFCEIFSGHNLVHGHNAVKEIRNRFKWLEEK